MDDFSVCGSREWSEDVWQVSMICPHAKLEDIHSDLLVTRNVEITVNRFLDISAAAEVEDSIDDSIAVHSNLPLSPINSTQPGLLPYPAPHENHSDPLHSEAQTIPTDKSSSDTGCSTTDINSDSDGDYRPLVNLPSLPASDQTVSECGRTKVNSGDDKVNLPIAPITGEAVGSATDLTINDVGERPGSSGTDINSDSDIECISHSFVSQTAPGSLGQESPVIMYGGHCMSDSSDGGVDEPPSPAGSTSKPLSISSDDEALRLQEAKPLSSFLSSGNQSHSMDHVTQDVDMDELPELDMCQYDMDTAETDSAVTCASSTDWSQRSLDTVSASQTSTSTTETEGKGKKKRRTPEEIAESKRLAEARKAQRELEKKEKEERKKRDVQTRKAMQEAKKQLRPGDCMKYITVVVDLGVINAGPGAAILAAFNDSEVKCVAESLPVPNTVTWRRKQVEHKVLEDGSFQLVETEQTEPDVLLILTTHDFIQLTYNSKQSQLGMPDGEPTLLSHVRFVQRTYDDRRVTVIALGMAQYFRDIKTNVKRQHREAVRTAGQDISTKKRGKQMNIGTVMSRIEVEEVLVGLQLETGCNCELIETSKDLTDLVKTFTKAVAEAPSKKDRLESAFSFHCEGGSVGKVDKNGAGLLKVWKEQLQQFKTISTEMANAIICSYPSPRLLIEAYRKCSSEREAERLLEDIVVRRGAGTLATNRRIGKELSRRVYQLFNITDPEFVIA